MISEYHINLLLEKLNTIIANQEAILKAMRSREQIVVSSVPDELDIEFQEAKSGSVVIPEKSSGTGRFKESYQLYKNAGGLLPWNSWLKAGRPIPPKVP